MLLHYMIQMSHIMCHRLKHFFSAPVILNAALPTMLWDIKTAKYRQLSNWTEKHLTALLAGVPQETPTEGTAAFRST